MNKVRLNISRVASETGPLLKKYLKDKGVYSEDSSAVVCYGAPTEARISLNGNCGRGKIRNMEALDRHGVPTVPWFKGDEVPRGFKFPALARRLHGHGGEDIIPVFQPEEVEWRSAAGWQWFSSYVPIKTEYRVWVFRNEVLDVYEKVMERPSEYKHIGRNFRNGFEFKRLPGQIADAGDIGIKSIAAIGYDFAAVDMLRGTDNKLYVLECNTAPGVIRSKSHDTLWKLGDRIVSWTRDDYPER